VAIEYVPVETSIYGLPPRSVPFAPENARDRSLLSRSVTGVALTIDDRLSEI